MVNIENKALINLKVVLWKSVNLENFAYLLQISNNSIGMYNFDTHYVIPFYCKKKRL